MNGRAARGPIMAAMSGHPSRSSSLPTRAARLAGITWHLLAGLLTAACCFPFYGAPQRQRAIRRWSARLLRHLGVRLQVDGELLAARPLMLVANHVSWLDIFAINAVQPARFVAKSEIRRWPAIGWLCERAGTLFIERGRRADAGRVNALMTEALRAGDLIAVFPEGTTSNGARVLRFHSALLQPALKSAAAVQPVVLRFEHGDGRLCTEAAYDGDKSLWRSLCDIVARPVIVARVSFLPALPAQPDRRALADAAHAAIANRLPPP
jgi:1-acyl-sn-glycerol-3-phosphate acyltransferase